MTISRLAFARYGSIAAIVVLYCLVFGWSLKAANGIPYGLDNNETFSNWIHARNMDVFGLGGTYGLTDESYGTTAQSHPFVYTHQGNFPRFYIWLLFALGVESVQAQIAITTFTVGLGALLFGYAFVCRISRQRYGFIFVGLFLTDYLLIAQWVPNTWRVWHFFIGFLALFLATIESTGRRRWVTNFSLGLCGALAVYTELTFGVFLIAFIGLFLVWTRRRQIRSAVVASAFMLAGGALAAGILVTQVILFLGWDGFISDISLTFMARNGETGSSAHVAMDAVSFARDNNLVYWNNTVPPEWNLRTPLAIIQMLGRFALMPYSMAIGLACIAIFVAFTARWLGTYLRMWTQRSTRTAATTWMNVRSWLLLAATSFAIYSVTQPTGPTFLVPEQGTGNLLQATLAGVAVSSVVVAGRWLYQRLRAGRSPLPTWLWVAAPFFVLVVVGTLSITAHNYLTSDDLTLPFPTDSGELLIAGTSLLLSALAGLWIGSRMWKHPKTRRLLLQERFWPVAGYLVVLGAVSALRGTIFTYPFRGDYPGMTPEADRVLANVAAIQLEPLGGNFLVALVLTAATLVGVGVAANSFSREGSRQMDKLTGLYRAVVAATLGLVAAFVLVPGYVVTGYFLRYAPLAVFPALLLVTFTASVLLAAGTDASARLRALRKAPAPGAARAGAQLHLAFRYGTAVFALLSVAGIWMTMQATYVTSLDPTRYNGLFEELAKLAPSSSASTTYAAPSAVLTRGWSYISADYLWTDPQDHMRTNVQKNNYVWLADADYNWDYARPDYFVCWNPRPLEVSLPDFVPACIESVPDLAKQAGNPVTLVARDEIHGRWAIYRLPWASSSSGIGDKE